MTENTQSIQTSEGQNPKRGGWYLLTGLILGLIIGLVFSLVLFPAVYRTTDPSNLAENPKATYRLTIAQVYAVTSDFDRARERLSLLNDENPVFTLGSQAQRALAAGLTEEARSLALLASALSTGLTPQASPVTPTFTPPVDVIPTQTLPELTPIP